MFFIEKNKALKGLCEAPLCNGFCVKETSKSFCVMAFMGKNYSFKDVFRNKLWL